MLSLDHARSARRGIVETVYAPGKTPTQIADALTALTAAHGRAIATRVAPDVGAKVRELLPDAHVDAMARALTCGLPPPPDDFCVGLVTAGTADQAVAAETALCVRYQGLRCLRVDDVGVAGLWRLMAALPKLRSADAVIVCAGMDGALPAVVAGLLPCPVIGVPTASGYGLAAGGETALRTMLASCAEGLTVVTVEGGVQAAAACRLIANVALRRRAVPQA